MFFSGGLSIHIVLQTFFPCEGHQHRRPCGSVRSDRVWGGDVFGVPCDERRGHRDGHGLVRTPVGHGGKDGVRFVGRFIYEC